MSVIKIQKVCIVDLFDKLLEDRVLFITGEINDRLANFIVPAMLYLANERSRKPIKLYINSPGGSITRRYGDLRYHADYSFILSVWVCVGYGEFLCLGWAISEVFSRILKL